MRWMLSLSTSRVRSTLAERAIAPPSPPASASVLACSSCAASRPRSTLRELPLVDTPSTMSPAFTRPGIWRANTSSKPTSLPTAVSMAMSCARLCAGSAGRPAVTGCWNSTATCAASQLEPPLPMVYRRPPRRKTSAISWAARSTSLPWASKNRVFTATLSRHLATIASRSAASRRSASRASCAASPMVAARGARWGYRAPSAALSFDAFTPQPASCSSRVRPARRRVP
mmetsp:Transcript_4958/g.17991  ORF Transcript_4958/g.17991 Transcript_4958/m.17991 type:complete len:229 (-) Transcript_4958:3577-4263(-)